MPAALQNPFTLWLVLSAALGAAAWYGIRKELRWRAILYGSFLIACAVVLWPPHDRGDQKGKIRLGLDLKGGVHLVLGVQVDKAVENATERVANELRDTFRRKRLATNLKMPVSNLVRAILEDALDAVDAVGQRTESELLGIADRLAKQRDALRTSTVRGAQERAAGAEPEPAPETPTCPATAPSLEGVIGFQTLVLVTDAACTVCGRALPKGTKACRGVREEAGPRVLLGPECQWVPANEENGS